LFCIAIWEETVTDDASPSNSITSISGGVNLDAEQINIGGDVVGRDKITQTTIGYTVEQVSSLLTQISRTFQPKPFDGRCPYLGLDAFSEDDADRFFGRETLVSELVARVKESRFVVIAGPSGSGKSSLVRAGMIHALKQKALPNSNRWLYVTFTPGRDPIESLALGMSRLAKSPDAGKYVREHSAEPGALHEFVESQLSDRKDQRAVIFVDQFEEIFTQVSREDERVAFLNLLTHVATIENGRVTVLFALRSDFVSNCATYPQLNALLNQQFMQVGAMQPDELVSAIARPALQVGLRIDPDLVAQIVNDMQDEPGALPLMQFALKDLFDAQQAKGGVIALTLNDYLARGGLRKALERHADAAFAQLSESEQRLARTIFSGLIEIGHGAQDTRRTAAFAELVPANVDASLVRSVVQKLANARLITTDELGDEDIVMIAHERLIEAWPWLQRLVNENRDAIALQNQIAEDAQEWNTHQRDASYLYSGARLVTVREQLTTKKIIASDLSQTFIKTSIESEESALQREKARQQEEIRRLRMRNRIISVVGLLALAALLIALFFGAQSNQNANLASLNAATAQAASRLAMTNASTAQAESTRAVDQEHQAVIARSTAVAEQSLSRSRELAAIALNQLGIDPERGILIAMEAVSSTYTFEAEDVLRQALLSSRLRHITRGRTGRALDAEFSTDNQRLITVGEDDVVRVWDVNTGHQLTALSGLSATIQSVGFSPDGDWLWAADKSNHVVVWSATTFDRSPGPAAADYISLTGQIAPAALTAQFLPDDQNPSALVPGGTITVSELATGKDLYTFHSPDYVTEMYIHPDKTRLVTGGFDQSQSRTYRLWDMTTGQLLVTYSRSEISGSVTWKAVFSPGSGTYLAAVMGDGVKVWEVATGKELAVLRGHSTEVMGLAFSTDGRRLATLDYSGEVRIWDVITGRQLLLINTQARNGSGLVRFSPDDRRLVISGEDANYIFDVVIAGEAPTQFIGFGGIYWAALSPDTQWLGTQIQTPNNRDETQVWNVATGQVIQTLNMPASGARFSADSQWLILETELRNLVTGLTLKLPSRVLSFSPDVRFVAMQEQSGQLRIWDIVAQREVTTLSSTVPTLDFSPDDRYLGTATEGSVQVRELDSAREVRTWPIEKLTFLTFDTIRFLPDSTRLAVRGDGGTIYLLPISAGQLITVPTQDGMLSMEFSPNSQYMVTFVSGASTAQIWETTSGEHVVELRGPEEGIRSAHFSPDSQLIVTTHDDRTARVWDVATGRERSILRGHQAGGVVAQFQPDGRQIVTADPTGTILIEPASLEGLLALAKTRVTRELTCQERILYLHEDRICTTPMSTATSIP
jgi:WD40 repeat protein/energy-coupling factor transporter ATP-binding protein EcfA2